MYSLSYVFVDCTLYCCMYVLAYILNYLFVHDVYETLNPKP